MIAKLTEREHSVMKLICEGLSNKEIADRLRISSHTVKFHVNNACTKMCGLARGANRTLAAVRYTIDVMKLKALPEETTGLDRLQLSHLEPTELMIRPV